MRDFHVALRAVVGLNCPSAITLYSEPAVWSNVIHFLSPLYDIPRQIFVNGVFQYEDSLLSFSAIPSSPSSMAYVSLLVQRAESYVNVS